jgi:hypothetical protein
VCGGKGCEPPPHYHLPTSPPTEAPTIRPGEQLQRSTIEGADGRPWCGGQTFSIRSLAVLREDGKSEIK